jgi:hypothetical protein
LLFTPLRGENKIEKGGKKCIFRHSQVGGGGGKGEEEGGGKRMGGRRKKSRAKRRAKT